MKIASYEDEATAYVLVYSIADKRSFRKACDQLQRLRDEENNTCPIILVGNKMDLARAREVSMHDGKIAASDFCSKFVETSATWKHNVDELLVGTLKQIRLYESAIEKAEQEAKASGKRKQKKKTRSHTSTYRSFRRATKRFFGRLTGKGEDAGVDRTCEDLYAPLPSKNY
ncbi:GTP-binding protein GEM-like [Lingula anatina]|uniref:GTP-binding protein GEM-like n=1 Tax=Lingula anatina TaxID=7574 RepID=A0A1S3HZI6_LINAN|nr:GTP-binding protein GEM-like [Lingula anatina]|eukprot:XP_013390986.1 GTP-binding protein GEM-like [Lingula anatina]